MLLCWRGGTPCLRSIFYMHASRSLLGGRYSLERPLSSSADKRAWMAIDGSTGRLVVVGLVSAGRMSTLEPALGVKHRNLASIDDVVRSLPDDAFPPEVSLPGGAGVVVAEHAPGVSLRSVLEKSPLHPAKAVAWVMRLAEAVQALHATGAIHGAISPRAVIAEPEGRSIAPVLSQLIAPPIAGFLPPERVRGGAEASSDDVWSLFATLYAALTGASPFPAASREALLKSMHTRPKPLADFGVNEPALAEILARGLLPERRARVTDLAELVAALDAWERDPKKMPAPRGRPKTALLGMNDVVSGGAANARDDSLVIDDRELADDQGAPPREPAPLPKMPPPLPPSAAKPAPKAVPPPLPQPLPSSLERDRDRSSPNPAPPVAAEIPPRQKQPPVHFVPIQKRLSWNPFQRKRSVWPWIGGAAALLAGGAYLALAPRPAPPPPEPTADVEAPRPKRTPKPAQKTDAEAALNECVQAHFPQGSLPADTDFSFVCADGDFVVVTRDLFSLATQPAPAAGPGAVPVASAAKPEEKRLGLGLDWYELPATAIIRRTCCPAASPVSLPETPGRRCEQVGAVIQHMADDSAKSVDLAPQARLFDKTAGCLVANRVPHGYPYERAPKAASRAAFQEFLSRAAIIGARR
jgi:serine/threonine protein kinase